jgi:hypothetical protein
MPDGEATVHASVDKTAGKIRMIFYIGLRENHAGDFLGAVRIILFAFDFLRAGDALSGRAREAPGRTIEDKSHDGAPLLPV